jgi:hypothetical protein
MEYWPEGCIVGFTDGMDVGNANGWAIGTVEG